MEDVPLADLPPDRFETDLDAGPAARFAEQLSRTRSAFDGRSFWHVNSAAAGGGVAEILESALGYLRGAGIGAGGW